jgi:hypothetical protein
MRLWILLLGGEGLVRSRQLHVGVSVRDVVGQKDANEGITDATDPGVRALRVHIPGGDVAAYFGRDGRQVPQKGLAHHTLTVGVKTHPAGDGNIAFHNTQFACVETTRAIPLWRVLVRLVYY